jgi:hypothetical protein
MEAAMQEKWKALTGYEGLYEVSNMGWIRSLDREVWTSKGGGYYKRLKGKVLKPYLQKGDRGCKYYYVSVFKEHISERVILHIAVAKHFVPNPFNLPEVNHIDTDKLNNAASNLGWVTRSGNMLHAPTHKTLLADNNSKRVKKLTKEQADLMKHSINSGLDRHEIAKTFGVHYSYVNMVARGERRV